MDFVLRHLRGGIFWVFAGTSLSAWSQEALPLPDGCNNPFTESGLFGDFFEKAIEQSVVDTGSVTEAHIQLFAVNRLRKYLSVKYPTPTDGDTIDKIIEAQICNFSHGNPKLKTTSHELHTYLLSIAPKLLRDAKTVTQKLRDKEIERLHEQTRFESHLGLVEKAERLGDEEISSYLKGP